MASKTTVTLPAGTVLTTTKSITVQGHTIEANATLTLGSSVTAEVGARPDQGLPGRQPGSGSGGSPDQGLPGSQPGVDNSLPGSQPGVDNELPSGGSGNRPDQGLPPHAQPKR